MMQGFIILGDDTKGIILWIGTVSIKFDTKIDTLGGDIWCGYFKQGY